MTMLLLILLVVLAAGAFMWRSERRRRSIHPGTGFGDGTEARGSDRSPFYTGSDTDGGAQG